MPQDPYAEFGGSIEPKKPDPYAEFTSGKPTGNEASDYLKETLSSAPRSLGNFAVNTAKGLWEAGPGFHVKTISNTLQGRPALEGTLPDEMGRLTLGTVQKGVEAIAPGTTSPTTALYLPDERPRAEAFGQYYKNRYGSLDSLGNTFKTDPVGTLMDASMVAGGVGTVAKAANLPRVAQVANFLADATNPITVVVKGAGAATQPARSALANRMMRSAMKPMQAGVNLDANSARHIADVLLQDNLIPGSAESVERVGKLMEGPSTLRQSMINAAAAKGASVNPGEIAQSPYIPRAESRLGKKPQSVMDVFSNQTTPSPEKVEATVDKYLERYRAPEPAASGLLQPNGQPFPAPPMQPLRRPLVDEAQTHLENSYNNPGLNYGELGNAGNETVKSINRAEKNAIADAVKAAGEGDITPLNARLKDLLQARDLLVPASMREMSAPLGGQFTAPTLAARATERAIGTGPVGMVAGGLAGTLRAAGANPSLAARMAVRLSPYNQSALSKALAHLRTASPVIANLPSFYDPSRGGQE